MIILYPTETIYGLGVNALDEAAQQALVSLKGRDSTKTASWLVRSTDDIEKYAELSEPAKKIADHFLPGPVTLVIPAKQSVPDFAKGPGGTIGFRVSSDKVAQTLIESFMAEYNAPLTSTSANLGGEKTMETVPEILKQFGDKASEITEFYEDGPRNNGQSTVVRVIGENVEVIREGNISKSEIEEVLAS